MPKTPINGFEMYYEEGGSGAPVLYVHGGFASLDTRLASVGALSWTWENDFAARLPPPRGYPSQDIQQLV